MTTVLPPSPPAGPRLPPRRRSRPIPVAVAVAVVVALVAGVVVVTRGGDGPGPGPPAGDGGDDRPAATSPAEAEDALQVAVRELSDVVAEARGRPFLRAVDVELLADDAFVARLRAVESDEEALDESARLLRALGLLAPDEDLRAAVDAVSAAGVAGFYDPETDELVVRGSELRPSVRSTLVHELTHAWDDQHFELHRPALDRADDESGFGFSALVEGDAVRVERSWVATLSAEERADVGAAEGDASGRLEAADVPPIVLQLISLPYLAGPELVDGLLREGGERRVDGAFAAPPTTSEQVLDPARFVDGPEPAAPVPEPAADGPVVDRGTFGAAGVLVTLADELAPDTARQAAEGWGGDRYVTWADGASTCVRVAMTGDEPEDVDELARAWGAWAGAEREGGRSVRQVDDRVVVTACG